MIVLDVARTSAFVAFGCYTLSIAWGLCLAGRAFRPPVRPELDYHRFLAGLGALSLAVHVTAVLVHHANGVQLPALVLVRASPAAVAGVTAMWLVIALPLTHVARGRGLLSARTWRSLHYLGYAVWALSLAHGLGAGTDTRTPVALAVHGGGAAIVAGAACWRWSGALVPRPVARPAEEAR